MGNQEAKPVAPAAVEPPTATDATEPAGVKPKCKACCACPETKLVRDTCIVENGEENCKDLIEAHLKCMREQGFNI